MINYNELRDGQAFYSNGYKKGYEDAKKEFERAKGKWIECTKSGMPLTEYGRRTGEKWYGFKCSQCNFIYKGNALIDSPFCQKCGADMRKEAEKWESKQQKISPKAVG